MLQTNPVVITKELIQIESTNPGTGEAGIASYLKDYIQSLPHPMISFSEEEVFRGRKNIMAVLPSPSALPDLVFLCHLDTVPVGNGWTVSPFDAYETGSLLYGRGACDMKAGLACALTAFADAALAVSRGKSLPRTLRFLATVDEEGEMCGIERMLSSGQIPENALILAPEPTNGKIMSGHKGRLWFHLTIQGRAAHASTPQEGADAIAGMAEALSFLRREICFFPQDTYFGSSNLCFGQITGGTVPYAVSDSCTVTIDLRLVPPAGLSDAISLLHRSITHAKKMVPGITGSFQVKGNRPPIPFYEDTLLLRHTTSAFRTVFGKDPEVCAFPGYTDAAVASASLQNRNCLSFGPGNLQFAHKPDEFVPIQDIINCKEVFRQLIWQ